MNLQDCLDNGYLVKEKPDNSIVHKEIAEQNLKMVAEFNARMKELINRI